MLQDTFQASRECELQYDGGAFMTTPKVNSHSSRSAVTLVPAVFLLFVQASIATSRPTFDRSRLVTIDVAVSDKNGHLIAGLDRSHFKVFENGVEQTIESLGAPTKPINAVVLLEFSDVFASYEEVVQPAVSLIHSLPPDSWIALVTFGTQPEIVTDFTRDRNTLVARLSRLTMPFSRETRLYDAVRFVVERLQGLPGKNVVFLLSTGHDTISELRYSEMLKLVQMSDSTIYAIDLGQFAPPIEQDTMVPGAAIARLQAQNVMRALAEASAGLFYSPHFSGDYPVNEVFRTDLMYQYRLTYISNNQTARAQARKLTVEVTPIDLNNDGKPDKLKIRHKKIAEALR
jgi:VWFA-related protein